MPILLVIAQQNDGGFADLTRFIYLMSGFCIGLVFFVVTLIGAWGIFKKANQPGWAALIPVYNIWILLQIVGRPRWWLILYFVPVVGQIAWIINMWDLARSFERGIGHALGLVALPFVFTLLLGYDDMQHYYGPAVS